MPVVTFTLLKGQPAALKTKLGHAVHLALENAGVPLPKSNLGCMVIKLSQFS